MMSRQDMERLNPGKKVRGTYRGPLDWELCTSLYDSLQQARCQDGTHVFAIGTLFIVSQDDGYNIVRVERTQEITQNGPENQARCLRCHVIATWDVNGHPYCETCGPQRTQELLGTEGIASRFHCETGFTWDPDGVLIPITVRAQ